MTGRIFNNMMISFEYSIEYSIHMLKAGVRWDTYERVSNDLRTQVVFWISSGLVYINRTVPAEDGYPIVEQLYDGEQTSLVNFIDTNFKRPVKEQLVKNFEKDYNLTFERAFRIIFKPNNSIRTMTYAKMNNNDTIILGARDPRIVDDIIKGELKIIDTNSFLKDIQKYLIKEIRELRALFPEFLRRLSTNVTGYIGVTPTILRLFIQRDAEDVLNDFDLNIVRRKNSWKKREQLRKALSNRGVPVLDPKDKEEPYIRLDAQYALKALLNKEAMQYD